MIESIISKEIELATNLQRLTVDRKIEWEQYSPPDFIPRPEYSVIYVYYQTIYQNNTFAVYNQEYRHYTSEDDYYTDILIHIAVINDGSTSWRSQKYSNATADLFVCIQEQTSGISDIIANMG